MSEIIEITLAQPAAADVEMAPTMVQTNAGISDVIVDGESAVVNHVAYIEMPTVPTKTSQLTNDSNFVDEDDIDDMATQTWVEDQGYLTAHQSLTNYYTKPEVQSAIVSHHDTTKQNTLTAGTNITIADNTISATTPLTDVKVDGASVVSNKVANINLSTKQDTIADLSTIRAGASSGATAVQPSAIADMATKTWVAAQEYATQDDISDFPTNAEMATAISTHHDSTKQDELIAGPNIVIVDNVIAAQQDQAITDVKQNGTSVLSNKVANIVVPTALSQLSNDRNYQTQAQMNTAIQAHHDTTKQGVLTAGANITIDENNVISATGGGGGGGGAIDDVKVNGTTVVSNRVANVLVPTKTSDITNDSGFIGSSAIADMATKTWVGQQNYYSGSPVEDVKLNGTSVVSNHIASLTTVDNLTSAGEQKPLTANQGSILNNRIAALESIGKFIALWNSATGLAATNPPSVPYVYHTGDYFRVKVVGSSVNYKPSGTVYTGVASTEVATESVALNDMWFFDGYVWALLPAASAGTITDVQKNGTSVVSGGVANVVVPTKTSDLTNDSGFLTQHQDISGKQNVISDLSTIRSGAAAGATAIQPNTNITQLVNNAGYLTTHQDISGKQDKINDLATIRAGASAGTSAKAVTDTCGDIITHDADEFATSAQGALADSAIQPNTNVSQLTNDAGYLTSHQSLANYSTTTQMNLAIAAHHDSTKQDTISDLTTIRNGATAGSTAVQPAAITTMQTTDNLVTSVSAQSDDTHYVSAKCVYDIVGNLNTLLEGLL